MKSTQIIRSSLLSLALICGAASNSAFAQINITIDLSPPAPLYEARPVIQPGYVYAPGYWAWTGSRFVWVKGRTIAQREGYAWTPDRWVPRDGRYYREVGRWDRDPQFRPANNLKNPKQNGRHDNGRRGNDKNKGHDNDRGNGRGN